MRTQSEIVAEIEKLKNNDFLGFKREDLIDFLDFEHAKPHLKPEVTNEEWHPAQNSRENILKQMEDYMAFAWDKANNYRGLSAGRSMAHYTAWIWLLGDEQVFGAR